MSGEIKEIVLKELYGVFREANELMRTHQTKVKLTPEQMSELLAKIFTNVVGKAIDRTEELKDQEWREKIKKFAKEISFNWIILPEKYKEFQPLMDKITEFEEKYFVPKKKINERTEELIEKIKKDSFDHRIALFTKIKVIETWKVVEELCRMKEF